MNQRKCLDRRDPWWWLNVSPPSLIASIVLTGAITVFFASLFVIRVASAQATSSTTTILDHDEVTKNSVRLENMAQDAIRKDGQLAALTVKYEVQRQELEDVKRDIASAKTGISLLVTVFGLIFTALQFRIHYALRKKKLADEGE